MSKPPPIPGAEFTASDVLAPQFWTGKAERAAPGLDMACTKIAVDFQNLTRETAEECIGRSLTILREAASADVAFVAFLDQSGAKFESVATVTGQFVPCHPEELKGRPLSDLPWLGERVSAEAQRLRDAEAAAPADDGCCSCSRGWAWARSAGRLPHPQSPASFLGVTCRAPAST
jgi:hypothetical protein